LSLTTNTQLRARVFAPDLDPGLETSQVYLCLGADLESFSSNAGYYTGFIGKWGVNATSRDYLVQCAREFDFWSGSDLDQTAYWHERTCNYLTNRPQPFFLLLPARRPPQRRVRHKRPQSRAQGPGSSGNRVCAGQDTLLSRPT
jgi:hypothetical protein